MQTEWGTASKVDLRQRQPRPHVFSVVSIPGSPYLSAMSNLTHTRTDDISEVTADWVPLGHEDGAYKQLTAGPLGYEGNYIHLAGLHIEWHRYGQKIRFHDHVDEGVVQVTVYVNAEDDVVVNGRCLEPHHLAVPRRGFLTDGILPKGTHELTILVEPGVDEDFSCALPPRDIHHSSPSAVARLLASCRNARAMAVCNAPAWLVDDLVAVLRTDVLEQLEGAMRQEETPGAHLPTQEVAMRRAYKLVKQCEEIYTQPGADGPPRVSSMAAMLGVSKRTLYYAFHQVLGLGPSRYFQVLRLHAFREKLLRHSVGQGPIARYAMEMGFGQLGRLAGRYRHHFGESPSDTLRTVRNRSMSRKLSHFLGCFLFAVVLHFHRFPRV